MDNRTEALIEICMIWGIVKYFHPYLAYRNIDWDAALVAAVSQMQSSDGRASLGDGISTMLSWLDDAATRIIPSNCAIESTSVVNYPISRPLDNNTMLVDMTNYQAFSDWPSARRGATNIAAQIMNFKGIIFDLRKKIACPHGSTPHIAFASGIARALSWADMKSPGQRRREYVGYPPDNGGRGSAVHQSGFVLSDGIHFPKIEGADQKEIVFIADCEAVLPPVALALQDAGMAQIVADGQWDDRNLVALHTLDLGQFGRVKIRLGEIVYSDGTGAVVPDVVVSRSEDSGGDEAMEMALALLRDWNVQSIRREPLAPLRAQYEERTYAEATYPSLELRLLALFKIYNVIEHFFPYKDLMDENWDGLLQEFVPRFETAEDAKKYSLLVTELLAHLKDSHVTIRSTVLDDSFGTAIPPIRVRMCEGSIVVCQILDHEAVGDAEIRVGDIVRQIDGEDIMARVTRLGQYVPASTEQAWHRNALAKAMRGPAESEAVLTIQDGSRTEKEIVLPRRLPSDWSGLGAQRDGKVLKWVTPEIGYADLDRLMPSQVDEMFEMFAAAEAIIFDVRGYPNMTVYEIASRLTREASVHAALIERIRVRGPLKDQYRTCQPLKETFWQHLPSPTGPRYEGLTAMLMDETTQSHAEHTGLFLKAANGTCYVGSATAGANGDITSIVLPGGMVATFTGLAVMHPDGRQLQRVGLLPDVAASPTICGLQQGCDEVLQAAVAYLKAQISTAASSAFRDDT